MKLLTYITPLYNALVAIDPSLPRALFVALVFLTVMAWRKLLPASWIKFSSLIPVSKEDTGWFKETVRKLWQALPSAVLGAVYGALGTGGAVWPTLKLALLGLLAPVIHDVAARYRGTLGTKKNPPPGESQYVGRITPETRAKFFPSEPPPSNPPAAISAWNFLALQLRKRGLVMWATAACLTLAGCSRLARVDWSQVANCAEQPAESALTQIVSGVLVGTGDVKTELEGVAQEYGPGVVKCVVSSLVDQMAAGPRTASASHAAARGRAFLASVPQ